MRLRKYISVLAVFWCLAVWAGAGQVWCLPPAPEFLDRVAAARDRISTLEAVYEFQTPGEKLVVVQTVFFRAPDRIRLNLSWPDREEVFLAAAGHCLVLSGDRAADAPWPQPFLVYRLLVESETAGLIKLMKEFGFNLSSTARERRAGREIFIIGAQPGDLNQPQVWFDAETLDLIKLILPPGSGRPGYEVDLSDFLQNQAPRLKWPARIDVRPGEGAMVRLKLKSLRVNPELVQQDFDLEELRRHTALSPDRDKNASQDPGLVRIRRIMEWFRKKLE
ncbi:MAG: hypothetical protein V1742_03900 [Pseudomonadota bacterium]